MATVSAMWTVVAVLLSSMTFAVAMTMNQEVTCTTSNAKSVELQPGSVATMSALISVHQEGTGGYGCGAVNQDAIQAFEAMRWALELLNKENFRFNTELLRTSYVPGVKIGMLVSDTCMSSSQSEVATGHLYPATTSSNCVKSANQIALGLIEDNPVPPSSHLQSLTTQHTLPLVSYSSKDFTLHPHPQKFMRTSVPMRPLLLKATSKLLEQLGWKYVTVVHTNDKISTDAFKNLMQYSSSSNICFFDISISDDTSYTAVNKTLMRLVDNDAVGVVYIGDSDMAEALLKYAPYVANSGKLQWVFVDSVSVTKLFRNEIYQRGSIVVVPATRKIAEFEDHWVRLNAFDVTTPQNLWYKEWYAAEHHCDLMTNCTRRSENDMRSTFVQDSSVEPAIMAVYTYANALRKAHIDKCGGAAGLCSGLLNLPREQFIRDYIHKVNFVFGRDERVSSLASHSLDPYGAPKHLRFHDNGDIVNDAVDVFNFNSQSGVFKYRNIGTYFDSEGRLYLNQQNLRLYSEDRLTTLHQIPTSDCPGSHCTDCATVTFTPQHFYIHGDLILNSILPIHRAGDTDLTCSATIRPQTMMSMEAMIHGIQFINDMKLLSGTRVLNGVKLGLLGLDSCESSSLGVLQAEAIYNGLTKVVTDDGQNVLDPRDIVTYAGDTSAGRTIALSKFINKIQKPQISYATVSNELSDMERFPWFLRTIPAERKTIQAIISVFRSMGWSYIQVVYESPAPAKKLFEALKDAAGKAGICVVSSYVINNNREDVVKQLRMNPTVKPVVILTFNLPAFFKAVKTMNATEEFVFIGMEAWKLSPSLYENQEDVAAKAIIVHSHRLEFPRFYDYLANHNHTSPVNPWIKHFYAALFKCSFTDATVSTPKCSDKKITEKVEVSGPNSYALALVYTLVTGLDNALKEICGRNYNGVCTSFRNRADTSEIVMKHLSDASFYQPHPSGQRTEFAMKDREADTVVEVYAFNPLSNFTVVGQYNRGSLQISDPDFTSRFSTFSSTCPGSCLPCMYMFSHQHYIHIPGDLHLGSVLDLHGKGKSPFSCGTMLNDAFMNTEAVRFALDVINRGEAGLLKLNNVKLGALILDACSHRSTSLVSRFVGSTGLNDPALEGKMFPVWMTDTSESSVKVAALLKKLDMAVISRGARSPVLDDKTVYSTFFRTAVSDGKIIDGMVKVASASGFQYVVVLNDPDMENRDARDKFIDAAADSNICIAKSLEFEIDDVNDYVRIAKEIESSGTEVVVMFAEPYPHIDALLSTLEQRGVRNLVFISNRGWKSMLQKSNKWSFVENSLTFEMSQPRLSPFENYIRSLNLSTENINPWFVEYYEMLYNCNLYGNVKYPTQCQQNPSNQIIFDSRDSSVLSTFDAVYAYSAAVDLTLKQLCGDPYIGVCGDFYTNKDTYRLIVENMDRVEFDDAFHLNSPKFQFVDRESNRRVEIRRITATDEIRIGNLDTLSVNSIATYFTKVKATCMGQCVECEQISKSSDEYSYIPGDVIIAGLFDVHKPGSTPYTCGGISGKHSLELSEAFNYAIKYVNDRKGIFSNILNGVRIGGLAFDVCGQPSRAGNLVANIHSGNKPLTKDGVSIPASRIDVYVGPFTTESSIRVADVLDVLGVPMISYGATSMELQDLFKYRYFLRSVPADDKQARAIISFLKFSEINYVQTIYSFNSVGEEGRQEFVRLANLNGICVTANHVIGKGNTSLASQITDAVAMLANNKNAKTVILFVDEPLLVLQTAEKNPDIAGKYLMIGTDKWGLDLRLSNRNLHNVLTNAVTFDIESADVPDFDSYLDRKTPSTYKSNPWFKEYYEHIYNCSSTNLLRRCESIFGISRSPNYVQDTYALYVINAVFSAALGIHKAIESQCRNYDYACDEFMESGERRQLILSGIKSSRFTDATRQPFYYTPSGESNRGYHIYKVVNTSLNDYHYENLGSYNDTHFLKIDHEYKLSWQSRCGGNRRCLNCDFTANQPSRFMLNASAENLNVIGIFDVHEQQNRFQCGDLNLYHGFQNMLAFHYAIDEINRNRDRDQRATLKFGGLALDTCSNPARLGQDIYSLLSGEALCSDTERGQLLPPATVVAYITMGSENSIIASNILSPRKVTSFSPTATSVELSNKRTHSHFLRAVPPDDQQADVMVSLLQKFGFRYASAVYSSDNYGRNGRDQLLNTAYRERNSVCIAKTIPMNLDATMNDATEIVKQLQNILGSKVVILFLTTDQTRLLLQAARDLNLVGRFTWLGSERWGHDKSVVVGLNEISAGAITLQIHSEHVEGFQEYMKALSLDNHGPLPKDWFEEFYQTVYECRIIDSLQSKNFPRVCDGTEKVEKPLDISQDRSVFHTIITMNMISQGVHSIDDCRSTQLNVAGCLDLLPNKRERIYQGISDAQWTDPNNEDFNFQLTDAGYGNIRYNVFNYYRNATTGTFDYKQIGTWQGGSMDIDIADYHGLFSAGGSKLAIPDSKCPVGSQNQCEAPGGGTYTCVTSTFGSSRSGTGSVDGSGSGSDGTASGFSDGSSGYSVDNAARFLDAWGIIVVVLASIGAFMSLCLFIYLLIVYPMRAGTSVLGYLLVFGVIMMFLMVFPFVLHANSVVCGIRRFGLSLAYCICFAAMFVKLVDSWRSRKKADLSDVKYSKLGQPLALFFIAILLVIIQVLLNAEWLGFQAPTTVIEDYKGELWKRCAPGSDTDLTLMYDKSLALSMIYVHVLILLCFLLGCLTWRSRKNHNEARWIFIVILFTIPCVVLWSMLSCIDSMPVKYRDAAVAIGVLFNAYVMFVFIPVRKLYLYHKFHSQEQISEEVDRLSTAIKDPYSLSSSVYGHQYDNTPRYHDDSGSQSNHQTSFTGY